MNKIEYQKWYRQTHKEVYRAATERWRKRNPEKAKAAVKRYGSSTVGLAHKIQANKRFRIKWREKAIFAYGGDNPKCSCCEDSHKEFLTIDHIANNGKEHRKTFKGCIEIWLAKNNYPKGFQLLCFNCNWAKAVYGKCPHS